MKTRAASQLARVQYQAEERHGDFLLKKKKKQNTKKRKWAKGGERKTAQSGDIFKNRTEKIKTLPGKPCV